MTVTAAPAIKRHASNAWRLSARVGIVEVVVVVVSFLIYFAIRGMVVGRAGEAMVRGINVISLEQNLGIYRELTLQSWIIDHYWLIKVMNGIYFWGHMPLIVLFAVWLYVWHRSTYILVRNAFLASGAIGVVIYWAFPVAPPRLIPFAGFVDTMAVFDRVGYNAQETKGFVNEYAAIPSLHFGWSMLLGLAIFSVTKNPALKVFGLAWPVAMFFAVVMTGNHFIVDTIIGAIVSFAGLGIAWLIRRYGAAPKAWVLARLRSGAAEVRRAANKHPRGHRSGGNRVLASGADGVLVDDAVFHDEREL
jgi:PAP2 superfamily